MAARDADSAERERPIDLLAEVPPASEPVLVAVDFTADQLSLLFADADGRPLDREQWPLPPLDDEEAWAWEVGGRIAASFALEGQRRSALAIAVAAPGQVHPVAGRLERSTGQHAWDGLPVVELLRRHFGAPVAVENRIYAALLGETWQGAAVDVEHALYVSLRGIPQAAMVAGGRLVRGAEYSAGALPALPELDPAAPLTAEALEHVAGLLADAVALLDPATVIIDAAELHLAPLLPLLREVLARVAPGPEVVAAALGESAVLIGALRMATTLAYEWERKP